MHAFLQLYLVCKRTMYVLDELGTSSKNNTPGQYNTCETMLRSLDEKSWLGTTKKQLYHLH